MEGKNLDKSIQYWYLPLVKKSSKKKNAKRIEVDFATGNAIGWILKHNQDEESFQNLRANKNKRYESEEKGEKMIETKEEKYQPVRNLEEIGTGFENDRGLFERFVDASDEEVSKDKFMSLAKQIVEPLRNILGKKRKTAPQKETKLTEQTEQSISQPKHKKTRVNIEDTEGTENKKVTWEQMNEEQNLAE